jgi:hypothetical protein
MQNAAERKLIERNLGKKIGILICWSESACTLIEGMLLPCWYDGLCAH